MSKRLNGEGMVRKHPSKNLYEARYSYTDPITEKRKRGSVYGKNAQEALTKLRGVQERLKENKPPTDSRMTVSKWIDQWQSRNLPASNRKETTKETYRLLSSKHLKPSPFGELELSKVRPSHIDELLEKLKSQGYSESTIRNLYAVLNSILDGARRDELIAVNPIREVRRPRVSKQEAKHLSPESVRLLLDASVGSRYETLLRLIAATGLRRGEAIGLEWSDIQFEKKLMQIRFTVSRVQGKLHKSTPKTSNSRREIPLSDGLIQLLKTHRKNQNTERLMAGDKWLDNGLVFSTELGGLIDPRNLLRVFTNAAKAAGLEKVSLHTLRHSAATAMLNTGTPMHVVSRILGHSSISITVDTYGHITEDSQRDAMDGLSSALGF
ncbi:integrase [Aurantimicrobium minutum]|uniref:tyrosine-type recombinase/integrase n=1 Tax=Aurantimicrobium minutum TaxID=708131 RepID=UPI002475E733|nr:site-specific integrase [Aurantimicrobium minutum]MDH6410054.1 integrase [Aurantimicrobium minutum]